MYRSRSFPLVLLVTINFLLNSPANAGVVKRSIRMVREVYPPDIEPENEGTQPQVCIVGDVVYGAEEAVPAEQPCLKCRCQPPGVQCETVQCAKKPGCKAIHRSNKCCPDYQCECEHNGKIYANGEKLETNPGGECKVCYCRGGEVQCAEVSCYIRKDCEGKRVPGTCCPRYDHCPPIDALPDRTHLTTEPPSNTLKPVVLELWQDSANSTDIPNVPTLNSIPEDSNKVPDTSYLATITPTFQEIPKKEEGMLPRITIQEIIPERKEIPITAPPKIFISEPQGTLLIEEALPTDENTSNDLNLDTEPDSSEISEVFQHPPPILRIGDKLLFLKKGELVPEKDTSTPQSVITIIGAEGLQRGGVEESLEVHEEKIEPEIDEIKNNDAENNDVDARSKVELLETKNVVENNNSKPQVVENPLENTKSDEDQANSSETNNLELKTAESIHILSLVKKKDRNVVSITTSTTQEPTTSKEEVLTTLTSSIEEPRPSEASKLVTESSAPFETPTTITSNISQNSGSNLDTSTISLPSPEPTTEPQLKNTEPISEQNPAYPPLPDIMPAVGDASQKFEIELENDNATTMEIKILPEVYDLLSNKTKDETQHIEWLKLNAGEKNDESLVNFRAAALPDELLKQRAPIDETEENTTEVIEVTTFGCESVNAPEHETLLEDTSNTEKRVDERFETTENDPKSTEKPESKDKLKDKLLKEGAQLIAEVKLSDDFAEFNRPTTAFVTPPIEAPGASAETDKTRKQSAQTTKEVLEIPDVSANSKKLLVEYVKTSDKSIESLEVDSGEQTTPKSNHSALVSNENASVEKSVKEGNSEMNDMIKEGGIELGSVELDDSSSRSVLADVEMIGTTITSSDVKTNQTSSDNVAKQDVELINVMNMPKPTKMDKIESSTYELLPTPEETKSIIKREVASENPQEDIFKELEKELSLDSPDSRKNPDDEKLEADQVFKELLDESKGVKIDSKPKSKELEQADKVGDALAGFLLKGKAPDPKIFRLVGELFRGKK